MVFLILVLAYHVSGGSSTSEVWKLNGTRTGPEYTKKEILSGNEGARTGVVDPGGRAANDEDEKTEAAIRENQQHNKDRRY